jgi:uncharacterized protein YoxC
METHQTARPIPSPGANRWLYIILAVFAMAIIALSIWLISAKSDLRVLQDEKEAQRLMLQQEVDSLIDAHNNTKLAYGALADSLIARDSIIQANAQEIKKLLDTQWEYYKIKRKLERLQVISQGYVRQMDSLYTVNQELTEENERIREEVATERKKAQQLIKTADALTEKVELAAVFKTYNVEVVGVRQRGRGETETDRANRVERIKICFTLAENSIIHAGNKNIYIRIADPESKILVKSRDDAYSFMYKGERLQYSIMEIADYQNTDQEVCVYWDKRDTQELQPGLYYIDIYEGDHQIGEANLLLR